MKNFIVLTIHIVMFIMAAFFLQANYDKIVSLVSNDKDVYNYGITIKVIFTVSREITGIGYA
jgi:hypothetical protein